MRMCSQFDQRIAVSLKALSHLSSKLQAENHLLCDLLLR